MSQISPLCCHYGECRYGECRYAECRYAECCCELNVAELNVLHQHNNTRCLVLIKAYRGLHRKGKQNSNSNKN